MSFTIGSLFDGSGGFPLAAFMCGGTPIWASEIEPYPIAVTKTRFPYMKHLGSVTDIKGNEIDPVDVITFGSPCQDLSVAGKRAGLKHTENGDEETTRSGLFMEAVRIIKEMREATNGAYPRFAVWENVPGAFSSNKGEDFRIVLEELIKIAEPDAVMPTVPKSGWPYADSYSGDGWSIAYRVLDAQFWGVPQRRRRIYLVLDLGSERAGEILFEREGLRGYFEEGRAPWESLAGDAESGAGTADCEGVGINGEVAATLDASYFKGCGMRQGVEREVVAVPVAYSFDSLASNSMKSSNPYSGCRQVEVAKTLDCFDPSPAKNQGGIAVLEPIGFDGYNSTDTGDKAATLGVNCGMSTGRNGVVIAVATQQGGAEVSENGVCPTVTAAAGMSGNNQPWVCYPNVVLDDQGGSQISVRGDGKCPTLRAEMHGNIPCVMEAAGFCPEQSAKTRGIGYEEENSPTLRAGVTPAVVCKCFDARGNGDGSIAPTITGDHNNRVTDYTSVLVEPICCIDGDKIGKAERAGGSGLGIRPGDAMYTLTAKDVHGVCVPIQDQATRFAGKRGDKCDGKGNGLGVGDPDDPMFTLTGGDRHAVAYGIDPDMLVAGPVGTFQNTGIGWWNESSVGATVRTPCGGDATLANVVVAGVDCRNATEYPELNGCLQAKPNGGFSLNCNQIVRVRYIVRRLTPTECARLQGFPDGWGHPDRKDSFTDEEYEFWLTVRNTHAEINGKATKDYTRDQMLSWYNKLHTDSSEYKMWGNGIALPTALYVMQGIEEALK